MTTGQAVAHEASRGGDAPPEIDGRALRRAQLAAIYEQGASTLAVSAAIMIVCALLLTGHVDARALTAWLALGLASVAVRVPVALRCARLAAGDAAELPMRLPLGLTLVTASVYGALALFYDPSLPVIAQLVLVLFPAAVTVSIVPSYGHWAPLFFAFGALVMVPLLGVLLLASGSTGRLLAVPVLLFMVGESMVVRRAAAQMLDGLRLRLGNEALVARLTERAADLESARDAARHASRAKGEFLARMSHELRTPLNGVLGMSQLLATSELDAEQRQRLATLEDSGHALLGLVDQLLDMTLLQADGLRLRPRPTRPDALLERVRTTLGPRAEAAGIELELALDPGVPACASLDPSRVGQVLRHLVDNALKFTDRGTVSVRLASTGDARLLVVVEDTGIGMAPELVRSMFDLFVQGDGTDSRRHGGTGLGLSIVQELVALMDGTVRATSSPGIGTRVVVDLPLVEVAVVDAGAGDIDACGPDGDADVASGALPAPARAPTPDAATAPPAGRERPYVLVAEDNPVNRLVVEAMLEELGCEVELAHDGAQALEAVRRRRPDLVLMDCQMPVLDGFEATRRLRASGPGDLPVVAVTANALEGDRERCLEAGMDDYLTKPLDREGLAEAIGRWSGGRERAALAA